MERNLNFILSCASFLFFSRAVAQNRKTLHKLGITHVLNAAHSKQGSIGDQSFYENACIYLGIPAEDSESFDLSQYFKVAVDFIHKVLKNKDGKKKFKVSRIASICFTFLFLCHRKSAGALHHGSEPIGHIGAGLPDDAAAALAEGVSEARHAKTSYLS